MIICSCRTKAFYHKEIYRIDECVNKWVKSTFDTTQIIKVLDFSPRYKAHFFESSCFLIGVLINGNDAIAVIDPDFSGYLKKKQIIKVIPTTNDKIGAYQTGASSNKNINDLYCSVKKVYCVKIVIE